MAPSHPKPASLPEAALHSFLFTLRHTGSLGLSWSTYGYLAHHLLTPEIAPVDQPAPEREACPCTSCAFNPIEAPWTSLYRTRHAWSPRTVQVLMTGVHILHVYRGKKMPVQLGHMYTFASLTGGLLGAVVATKATAWVVEGGLMRLLSAAKDHLSHHRPHLTKPLATALAALTMNPNPKRNETHYPCSAPPIRFQPAKSKERGRVRPRPYPIGMPWLRTSNTSFSSDAATPPPFPIPITSTTTAPPTCGPPHHPRSDQCHAPPREYGQTPTLYQPFHIPTPPGASRRGQLLVL